MKSKKNIVFILADQLRDDFLGCYGADWLKTPNIDNLAKESVRYCDAVSPSPACVPARASILTGLSAIENRVLDNSKWLRPDHEKMGILTWPQKLVNEGYHTAAIGKMHFYPWDIKEGFQHRVIAEDKRHIEIQDDYSIFLQKHGYRRLHGKEMDGYFENKGAVISMIPEKYQIDRFVSDETISYIDTLNNKQPFAMMVGFPGPHCPYDPSKEAMDNMSKTTTMPTAIDGTKETERFRSKNILDNSRPWNGVDISEFTDQQKMIVRRHYSAMVQEIDNHVGEIIKKLKEKNLYDDTIIILTADHGDYLGDFGMAGKGHFYRSSYNIPLIIKAPGQEGMVVQSAVSLTDLHNTILHFAGMKVEDTKDSTVLFPFGNKKDRPSIFGCNQQGMMIRNSQYLLTRYNIGVRELYDIKKDPYTQHNLIEDPSYLHVLNKLRDEMDCRLFYAMNEGNVDNIGKFNNMGEKEGCDEAFNHEGWQRPYPFCKPENKKYVKS